MNNLAQITSVDNLNDDQRLKALAQYKISYSETSARFDELAILSTFIFSAPYAFISFIDNKKQWLKSSISLPFQEIELKDSFCLDLINSEHTSVILIEDALNHPRFKENPMVKGFPHIRFFISIPVFAPNGAVIGSVAVLDSKPRTATIEQISNFKSISSQVSSQLELLKSNDDLKKMMAQLAKLSDLGIYAATIAHEINTPLTTLTNQTELLELKIQSNMVSLDVMKKFVESFDRNIKRITRIVGGLKNLTRNSSDDPFESTLVNAIFNDISELCSKMITDKNISLSFDCQPNNYLNCRSSQIAQVLVNLVNNAVDAIEHLPVQWIKVGCMSTEDHTFLTVTDSGNGIPKEVSDKMFSQFFTTKEPGKGTGIGLTISTQIIKDHNGEMYIDNTNKNTKFVIKLPKKTTK
jgi:signal transduction histidine kinase